MPLTNDTHHSRGYDPYIMSGFRMQSAHLTPTDDFDIGRDFPPVLYLAPAAAVDVRFPNVAVSKDLTFFIRNVAAGASTITFKTHDEGVTVGTLAQNAFGCYHCDGTAWRVIA